MRFRSGFGSGMKTWSLSAGDGYGYGHAAVERVSTEQKHWTSVPNVNITISTTQPPVVGLLVNAFKILS